MRRLFVCDRLRAQPPLLLLALLTGCSYRALPVTNGLSDGSTSNDLDPSAATSDLGADDLAPLQRGQCDLSLRASSPGDLARADLSSVSDLASSEDLAHAVARDLSVAHDLSAAHDLSVARDLSAPADLSTPGDLASPPDRTACTHVYRNWIENDVSLASSSPCGLDSLQCGWAFYPACDSTSLWSSLEPSSGQIEWSIFEVGLLGDWIGPIDAHGHFVTTNDAFPLSTFVGDIDGNCHMTGTIDWHPNNYCIGVWQVSAVPR